MIHFLPQYEYEDAETPEVIVEYEYVDEEPPPPPPPRPKYKPSYHHHHQPSLHGHLLAQPRPRYHKTRHENYQPRPQPRPHARPQYHEKHFRPEPSPYPRYSQSGPEFLSSVSGLLERAENSPPHITLSGSLRSALLQGVDHHARAELHSTPGGHRTQGPHHGHNTQHHHQGHHRHHRPHHAPVGGRVPETFSRLMEGGNQGATQGRGATFSQLMGDLLVGKPRIPGIA